MLINFVDATNDANHYTKPPPNHRPLNYKSITPLLDHTTEYNYYKHRYWIHTSHCDQIYKNDNI